MQVKRSKKAFPPLEKFRKEIDKIDDKISQELVKRQKVVTKIAQFKQKHDLKTKDNGREKSILKKFKHPFQNSIFKKILQESKVIQRKTRDGSLKKS